MSVLVVAPWTLRNWLVFDAFVPVSTSGALNLWQGNTRLSRQEVYEEYWAVHGRVAQYEHARRRAIESILERQPLWILEKLRDEMPAFWAAHGQPIVHLERGAYGAVSRPRALAAVAVLLVPYLAVIVLFVVGVAAAAAGPRAGARARVPRLLRAAPRGRPRVPPLPPAGDAGRLPGRGPRMGRRRVRPRVVRPHRLAAAATALVLALSVGPSLVAWVTQPWPPPWFAGAGVEGVGPEEAPPQEGH